MTIAMECPATDLASDQHIHHRDTLTGSERVFWRSPAQGLWVGETPTAYLGMVDRNHDGFVATGFAGQDLGVHGTIADAKLAVYTHWFFAE
jgi:hypothetical protein